MNTRKLSLSLALFFSALTLVVIYLILGNPLIAKGAPLEGTNRLRTIIAEGDDIITVKLTNAPSYELTAIFQQLLLETPGVEEVKQFRSRIEPDDPSKCLVEWQVKTGKGSFDLEKELYQQLKQFADNPEFSDALKVPFTIIDKDREMMAMIRPYSATTREIRFVLYPADSKSQFKYKTESHIDYSFWPGQGFE